MALVLVVDLPTWLVGMAGVCTLAVFVWQGEPRAVRCESRTTPVSEEDAWCIVSDGASLPVAEAVSAAGEVLSTDVIETDELAAGIWAPGDVAEAAPVAAPDQYFYTRWGHRMHMHPTCAGLRSAREILKSPTIGIGGRTRCSLCFPVAQLSRSQRSARTPCLKVNAPLS